MTMRAARMFGYKQPLRLEEIPTPSIGPEEVLVKVGGAGMCRTDFQLIDGYFDNGLAMEFPITRATRSPAGSTASHLRYRSRPACPRVTRWSSMAAGATERVDSATS
jgi:hypothetical protein